MIRLSPKQKACLLELDRGLLVAKYNGRHLSLTAFGRDYLKELYFLLFKGLVELTPPTEQGLLCQQCCSSRPTSVVT